MPISLYPTVEFCNVFQSFGLNVQCTWRETGLGSQVKGSGTLFSVPGRLTAKRARRRNVKLDVIRQNNT